MTGVITQLPKCDIIQNTENANLNQSEYAVNSHSPQKLSVRARHQLPDEVIFSQFTECLNSL